MTDIDICNLALGKVSAAKIVALADKDDISLTFLYAQARDELLQLHHWAFALKRTRVSAAGLLNCSAKTITFNNLNPDTITDSGEGFVTAGFEAGDKVTIEGSGSNNTSYGIKIVAAGTLTLETHEEVIAETLENDTDLKLYATPAHIYSFKYARPSDCLDVIAVEEITINDQPNWSIEGDYIVTDEIDSDDQITIEYIKQVTDTTKFSKLFIACLTLKLAAELAMPIANDKVLKDFLLKEFSNMLLNSFVTNVTRSNTDEAFKDSSWVSAGH